MGGCGTCQDIETGIDGMKPTLLARNCDLGPERGRVRDPRCFLEAMSSGSLFSYE